MKSILKNKSIIDIAMIAGILIWTMVIGSFGLYGIRNETEQTKELLKHQARSFFQQIVTTRSWNAKHEGVYVPVTNETQPNSYLVDENRDIVTQKGWRLTKINPAYMTRQISEIAKKRKLNQFHITSRNPIRPANTPYKWEIKALS